MAQMYDVEVTNDVCTRTENVTLTGAEVIDFLDRFCEEEEDDGAWSLEIDEDGEMFVLVEDADPECIGVISPK